ncbi:MAG TPA: rhodanese-like domain-containing protein [Acidimicrobiia bacterium]|nr:rhodanese-like domain-containing protein [Acidimicrobiia bacterium]
MTLSLSTGELRLRLTDPDTAIIDVRPLSRFNGWRRAGEARGGHISGAVALPSSWLGFLDQSELLDLLDSKGIAVGTPILYGDEAREIEAVRAALEAGGLRPLVYERWNEWVDDEQLPLEKLTNYERLVDPQWVSQLLAGSRPDTFRGEDFAVFHVNFGVPEEFADGHLPGSYYLDTNWLEAEHDWNRRSPAELGSALAALGISSDTTTVLYGRDTVGNPNEKWPGRRAGQIAATRAAAILLYAGVKDVRLLDGGYDHWVNAGYRIETGWRAPSPIARFGDSIPQRPEIFVDLEGAKAILSDPTGAALVSVRTWKEHTGQVSGYNYIEPKGRIAGDVWGNCGSDAYHMQHYRNVDNTMRPYPEIAANWAEAGITPDKWVAFYCGTGWRASETWFYAYLMGWKRIAVYDGGWFEWSQDPINNPIEVGDPDDEVAA